MRDTYVVYKGVRMTEQEAEARINNAYCDAVDKARARKGTGSSTGAKKTSARKPATGSKKK